jgi:transcriptional regulator with XRE-family HTH domain
MAPHIDGPKLKALREEKFWSQTQLAKRAGIAMETISMLENEHRGARNATVLQIARALDVHPNEFLKGNKGPLGKLGLARERFPDEMKTLLNAG